MQPDVKTNVQSSAFHLYLFGGVAAVLAALWWLVPELPAKPAPMGRQEQAYREEIRSLFGDTAAARCQYWAKHLYITCDYVNVSPPTLVNRGWKLSGDPNNPQWYIRDRWRLKLSCATLNSQSCKVEIWPHKGDA